MTADTYTPPAHGWCCFHCGETFHVEVQARGHFGSSISGEPMCVMRATAFARFPRTEWPLMYRMRELEQEVEHLRQQLESEPEQKWLDMRIEVQLGSYRVFRGCRSIQDVFNVYDSMEGRAIAAEAEVARLTEVLNTPQTSDFMQAVAIEAAHQRERWGSTSDVGKEDTDWFWLIGYLAGKALSSCKRVEEARRSDSVPDNDEAAAPHHDKSLHHIITTAAACLNWHAARTFVSNAMRPGLNSTEPE